MPRANRCFLPHHVWHLTHRCHKQEFLLKFLRDRRRWRQWLFEAKKRYGLSVLNYTVTSNHIHLLVRDRGERKKTGSRKTGSGLDITVRSMEVIANGNRIIFAKSARELVLPGSVG